MARRTHRVPEIGEVLFQFVTQGNYVKVIAVDVNTNTEITLVGDRRAGKETLQNAAIQKLKYVIGKKTSSSGRSFDSEKNLY